MTASDAAIDVTAGESDVPESLVELAYRKKLLVVAALSVTLFVTTMSQTVVATAAQSIVADIGGFDQFTWLFAGFSLAGAVAVPIVGKLSDVAGQAGDLDGAFAGTRARARGRDLGAGSEFREGVWSNDGAGRPSRNRKGALRTLASPPLPLSRQEKPGSPAVRSNQTARTT